MIFPLPEPDAEFRARWVEKVARANQIWERAWARGDYRTANRAHWLLCELNDLRDALVLALR